MEIEGLDVEEGVRTTTWSREKGQAKYINLGLSCSHPKVLLSLPLLDLKV